MICNKVIETGHVFEKKNSYIVDANVLLGLFGNKKYVTEAQSNPKLLKAIGDYNKAIDMNCKVYVPSIVISEFVNRFFKECFSELKKSNPQNKNWDYKKDYRNTENYKRDCAFIKNVLEKSIFSKIKPINDKFEEITLNQMFSFDEDDFNDRLIIHIANKNGFYLISGDADIKKISFSGSKWHKRKK